MATVVLLGEAFDTNSGTHTVTATPQVGDYIVIIVANTGSTATTTCTDNNSSGTYSTVATALRASSADIMMAQVRTAAITAASSTIFTNAPGTTTGGGLAVYAVRGIALVGTAAVRSNGIQSNQSASGTPAPVLNNTPLTGSVIITAVFNATSPGGVTARTSPVYTRDVNVGYSTPTSGIVTASVASGETSATITWGSTSASAFGSLAIEVDQTLQVNVSDSVSLTESVTMREESFINVFDAVTVVDLPFYYLDTVIISEYVNVQIVSGAGFSPNVFDAVTITEAVTMEIVDFINVQDSISVTENIKVELILFVNVNDSISVSENVQPEVIQMMNVNDSVSISESVTMYVEVVDIIYLSADDANAGGDGWVWGAKIIG